MNLTRTRSPQNGESPHDHASSPPLRLLAALLIGLGFGWTPGCGESQRPGPQLKVSSDATAPGVVADTPPATAPAATMDLDRAYVIGPTAARKTSYRIDWQAQTYPREGSGMRLITLQDDAVFALDGRNFLTRLRREDGDRVWRIPVADAVEAILGITYLPNAGQVFLTTDAAVLVLDAATGLQVDRQRLEKIAGTEPVVYGPFLIYGARNGQLVWHSFEVAFQWRAYQVAPSIRLPPVYEAGYLVTVGGDGTVMVLDAASASQLWSRQLLDEVDAVPAAGHGTVFVAGIDQHVWAFDLGTGRRMWRYLTESPLTESPVLIDDRLYQQIPSEGLVCFAALPLDSPGGEVIWKASGVTGSVLTRRRDNLLTWDPERRRLTLVGAADGAVVETIDLPAASHLLTSGRIEGDLYAASNDGRVVRLVPRN